MVPFDWADPFQLDGQLTEEERMIRDAAQGFAQSELQPRVQDAFRGELDAPELFPLMGRAGLLGATIPSQYGGAGAGYVAYGLIAREIERVDSGYRSMASVQSSLVMYPIHAHGSGLLSLTGGIAPGSTFTPASSADILTRYVNDPASITAPAAFMVGFNGLSIIADDVRLSGGGSAPSLQGLDGLEDTVEFVGLLAVRTGLVEAGLVLVQQLEALLLELEIRFGSPHLCFRRLLLG